MSKPTSVPEVKPPEVEDPVDDRPIKGPAGTRTPYPVDAPGLTDRPGSAPDYVPGTPLEPPGRM
jgi:hypothetical protein